MDDLYIRKVCDGDENAFRYFIQQYKNMAFSIAVSVVKDEYVAQEIVQDAFVKSFQNISSFKGHASFSTWFYRIVTNEALMYLRKNKNEILVFTDDDHAEVPDESIIQNLKNEEQAYWINEALQKLPGKESLVLRLFTCRGEASNRFARSRDGRMRTPK